MSPSTHSPRFAVVHSVAHANANANVNVGENATHLVRALVRVLEPDARDERFERRAFAALGRKPPSVRGSRLLPTHRTIQRTRPHSRSSSSSSSRSSSGCPGGSARRDEPFDLDEPFEPHVEAVAAALVASRRTFTATHVLRVARRLWVSRRSVLVMRRVLLAAKRMTDEDVEDLSGAECVARRGAVVDYDFKRMCVVRALLRALPRVGIRHSCVDVLLAAAYCIEDRVFRRADDFAFVRFAREFAVRPLHVLEIIRQCTLNVDRFALVDDHANSYVRNVSSEIHKSLTVF